MKRTTFKICFYIQKSRVAKDGQVPILLRVTINGQRSVTSVNLKVNPKNWNAVAGKSIANTRKDDEVNARLDTIRLRIMQIYREMEFDRETITAQSIVDKYLGRDSKPEIMLLDVFREHNDRCHKLAGNGMASATVVRYETSYKHTAAFIESVYRVKDIPIADVDHKFITDYQFWLRTERKCNHNSATKYLKNFKKIIRIALANDYISKDPFVNIKFKLDIVEREFLEDHEIKAIIDKDIPIQRLAQVRDVFIFAVFTGLAFSDLKGLKQEHLVRDNNGDLWIRKARQKTKNMCNIPLLNPARQILERYKNNPECVTKGVLLPTLCNQKMNMYLKELATICGINKEICTHTGRHSFATSVALANGVSIENVAKMLGHSDTKMTRHYARVLDKSIKRDMAQVDSKFFD
ncbi:site-specific integrase [Dysgonomonas macrotermitis]|uniref:Site-specific recombinase XerD n=1 Tax=Dysgonomonas macrotermitis TaxID=1346286 RepID=A0A1M4WMU8_9BACT|nr:site-specific integrase [Dysgonomonas macrotermitis]SHE82517.1 Site-specific recombinase XerD [Dysgonomonas macrotermitis]